MLMKNMWFIKKICQICRNTFPKSKLQEYVTIQGNKILCCDSCRVYIKNKKNKKSWSEL